MSDRRAVSAGHLAASQVAAANEPWRVAVGGNRVQNMTTDQIAQAFHAGQLNVRTPLWPPGTSGWQALGNFEQFQSRPDGGGYNAMPSDLSQFEEADDDPTRMWTGSGEPDLSELEPMPPVAPAYAMPSPMSAPLPPIMSAPPPARPSARTGPRQVSSRAPRQASMSAPTARTSSVAPVQSSAPLRPRRSSGLLLVAGLVGLVGLGSAILAGRGSWSVAASKPAAPEAATAAAAAPPTAEPVPSIAVAPAAPAEPVAVADPAAAPARTGSANAEAAEPAVNEVNEARLAKYEDTRASAFVAGEEPSAPAATQKKSAASEPSSSRSSKAAKARPEASAPARPKASIAKSPAPRRAAPVVAAAAPAPAAPKAKAPKAEAAEPAQAPANSAVNEAAAAALATSANLAASCRPSGGPAGQGKARIIYSPDGNVQSVEILTAKFRDTLTGSCVRMVFRRAKIPAFKGEPPTFIKSFTIPEE
jgi:hypothetical protein